ncbi:chaplin [Streptomyces olivoreticuli]
MLKKVAAAAAATGGLVLAGAGLAAADSGAQGAAVGSPGVVSGNVVQAPVHIPLNVCGNSINIIGALNSTFGNKCVNE